MSGGTIHVAEADGRLLVRIGGTFRSAQQVRRSLREHFASFYRNWSEPRQAFSFPPASRAALEAWCDRRCSEGVAVAWEGRA